MTCDNYYGVRVGPIYTQVEKRCALGFPYEVMVLSRNEGKEYHCPRRKEKDITE
jgi:hypothetical protein